MREKISIELLNDGEFCDVCRFIDSIGWCKIFGDSLSWGGEHNERKRRCKKCIDATINDTAKEGGE